MYFLYLPMYILLVLCQFANNKNHQLILSKEFANYISDARKIAAQSVDKKLFFGGEAMNINGHHQTVHGAVETGYREVVNVFNSL